MVVAFFLYWGLSKASLHKSWEERKLRQGRVISFIRKHFVIISPRKANPIPQGMGFRFFLWRMEYYSRRSDKNGDNIFSVELLCNDVLIIGGGLAGMYSALAAAESGAAVRILWRKSKTGGSGNSVVAMSVHRFAPDAPGLREDYRRPLPPLARDSRTRKSRRSLSITLPRPWSGCAVSACRSNTGRFRKTAGNFRISPAARPAGRILRRPCGRS